MKNNELFGIKYDPKEEKEPKKPLMSRRAVIKTSLGVAGAAAIGVGGSSAIDKIRDTVESKKLTEDINKKTLLIKQLYDVDVKPKLIGLDAMIQEIEQTEDREASLSKYSRALEYILEEFAKFPPFFIQMIGLRFIVVDDNLIYRGGKILGVTIKNRAEQSQREGVNGRIFVEISGGPLNKDKGFGWTEKEDFNGTFHHEFFHAIETNLNAKSFGRLSQLWVGLYEPGDFEGKVQEGKKGFISRYGQLASDEDSPEVFSAMINDSNHIWEKVEKDETLKKKVTFLQQVMFSNTFGLMDQRYWDLIRKGPLPGDYFQKRKEHLLSLDLESFKQELGKNNWKNYIFSKNEWPHTEEEVFDFFKKHLSGVEL
jgi:hypothetical protein